MKYSKMEQRILVIRLDALLLVMCLHGIVKIAVQQIYRIVVRATPPGVKEAVEHQYMSTIARGLQFTSQSASLMVQSLLVPPSP